MTDAPKDGSGQDEALNGEPPAATHSPAIDRAASGIAAGQAVDWPLLESSASSGEAREILAALHAVESIAAFHRSWPPEVGSNEGPTPPSTWGSLAVIREIGRGSFGRVHLARDARLDREVALKILDPAVAGDSPHGLALVEEGRHLARVRHPNIVTVYGAELVDGRAGIEMELVSGRTLAEIVRTDGPFGPDEAVLIGRDVCRALAAVHAAGLVHRDVKAQNVIRERGGRIVLMDFGSGRRTTAADPAGLAGTPLYLAPEVLAGAAHTPRSDLYSVGVLLYFLTTGSFPVEARTLDELRAAHQDGTRTSLRDARPDLPQPFVDLVERTLSASPASRPESAGRLDAELSRALGHVGPARGAGSTSFGWMTASILAIALTAVTSWLWWQARPPDLRTERFAIPIDGYLTIAGGWGSSQFALSPDGSRLAYSTMGGRGRNAEIRIRHMNDVESRVLANTGDAGRAFFSPDGEWLGFHQTAPTGGRMMKIALSGGVPVAVTGWPQQAGASWAADGTIVFSSRGDLWRVAESGGQAERLTSMDPEKDGQAIRPHVLPGGDVVFTVRHRGNATSAVAVLTRRGSIRTLVADATSGKFMPPGFLVYVAGNPPWIMAAPFDSRRLEMTGPPVQVQALRSPIHWFDVSASGSMAYGLGDEPDGRDLPSLVWVDRTTGRDEPMAAALPLTPGRYIAQSLRLAPDARRVAYATTPNPLFEAVDTPLPGQLWVGDLERGLPQLVTKEPVQPITWSRDSTRITYRTREGAIVWKEVDGSSPEELLAEASPDLDCSIGEWSPDGRVLLLGCGGTSGADPRRGFVALTFPSAAAAGRSPAVPEMVVPATPGLGGPRFSPDGQWIAYSANLSGDQGAHAVYVRAFPGPGPTYRVSPVGGRAAWRENELFYLTPGGPQVIAIQQARTGLTFSPPRAAFEDFSAYDTDTTGGLVFDVTPDGRRFLVMKRSSLRGGSYITRLAVALHWVEDVERAVEGQVSRRQ